MARTLLGARDLRSPHGLLMQAAEAGDVARLLELLAEPDDEDAEAPQRPRPPPLDLECAYRTSGTTPLAVACLEDHVGAVEALLRYGADPNTVDSEGNSPLTYSSSPAVVDLLLRHGAIIDARDTGSGATPFLLACGRGDEPLFRLLAARGADVNLTGVGGEHALDLAIAAGDLEAARFLLNEAGADARAVGSSVPPLVVAARLGRLDLARLLLARGADLEQADRDTGDTPLIAAARGGLLELTRELLNHGARVLKHNRHGDTAVHCARAHGHAEVARVLESFVRIRREMMPAGMPPLLAPAGLRPSSTLVPLPGLGAAPAPASWPTPPPPRHRRSQPIPQRADRPRPSPPSAVTLARAASLAPPLPPSPSPSQLLFPLRELRPRLSLPPSPPPPPPPPPPTRPPLLHLQAWRGRLEAPLPPQRKLRVHHSAPPTPPPPPSPPAPVPAVDEPEPRTEHLRMLSAARAMTCAPSPSLTLALEVSLFPAKHGAMPQPEFLLSEHGQAGKKRAPSPAPSSRSRSPSPPPPRAPMPLSERPAFNQRQTRSRLLRCLREEQAAAVARAVTLEAERRRHRARAERRPRLAEGAFSAIESSVLLVHGPESRATLADLDLRPGFAYLSSKDDAGGSLAAALRSARLRLGLEQVLPLPTFSPLRVSARVCY